MFFQTLKPLLEKLAAEYRGRFLLAKVNSDENQELAAHFGVRSIPTVKVVYQGQLVDEFTGALPEGQLRAFLDRIALPGQAEAGLREQAAALVADGQLEAALAKLVACNIMTTSLLYAGKVRRKALGNTTRSMTWKRLIP